MFKDIPLIPSHTISTGYVLFNISILIIVGPR